MIVRLYESAREHPLFSTATFAVAGGVGFLVDAGVLEALVRFAGIQVHFARVISFLAAVTATWLINRTFTFRVARVGGSLIAEWLKYFGSSLGGGAVNYAAFAATIGFSAYAREHLIVGVAVGSLAGMVVNYLLYSRFVFRRKTAG